MIYFVQAASGPVKIGKAVDVSARIATLATGHYEPLTVLATLDAPDEAETRFHWHLCEHRLRGEWFRWCPEVEAAIAMARRGEWPQDAKPQKQTGQRVASAIDRARQAISDAAPAFSRQLPVGRIPHPDFLAEWLDGLGFSDKVIADLLSERGLSVSPRAIYNLRHKNSGARLHTVEALGSLMCGRDLSKQHAA